MIDMGLTKEEIVARFMSKGHLLTPDALRCLEGKDAGKYIEKKFSGFIINEMDIHSIAYSHEEEKIRIIKNLTKKPTELQREDFIKFYNSKYEKMKNIIVSRIQKNFVSINKISPSGTSHIIAIIKDVKEKTMEAEDMTGSINITFDSEINADTDDVVAIELEEKKGKKIIYPDIPLRPPKKGVGKACFVSDLHMDEAPNKDIDRFFQWCNENNFDYLFVAGDIVEKEKFAEYIDRYCSGKRVFYSPGNADKKEDYPQVADRIDSKIVTSLSNPAMVEISGIKILLMHNFSLDMIKKRYLGKSKIVMSEDFLPLDEVPDIVHCGHTHQPFVSNYKSVTIVNSGSLLTEFRPVLIDFATREVRQVNLFEK